MNIRKIESKDFNRVITIIQNMISDLDKGEVARQITKDIYDKDDYLAFVAERRSDIKSFCVLKKNCFEGSNNIGEIVFLHTDEFSRKKGYGSKLVEYVEIFSKKNNYRKLYIKTSPRNKAAVLFWINRGYEFEVRMRDFSADGLDDYYLSKIL